MQLLATAAPRRTLWSSQSEPTETRGMSYACLLPIDIVVGAFGTLMGLGVPIGAQLGSRLGWCVGNLDSSAAWQFALGLRGPEDHERDVLGIAPEAVHGK